MTNNGSALSKIELNTALLARGAMLAMIGSFLVAIGMLLGGSALVSAARQWIGALDTPPSETARQRFEQLRVATAAGAKAWRDGTPVSGGVS